MEKNDIDIDFFFLISEMYFYHRKLRCELNNLVLKVSGAANLWHSLN